MKKLHREGRRLPGLEAKDKRRRAGRVAFMTGRLVPFRQQVKILKITEFGFLTARKGMHK
jgi:hypothetical protein